MAFIHFVFLATHCTLFLSVLGQTLTYTKVQELLQVLLGQGITFEIILAFMAASGILKLQVLN